jgi:2-oxoisovalerate dehydrogenase E2 component (dihydrolipoyl transacylase)
MRGEDRSDKATVEITSPYSGRITNLGGGVGDVIRVGAVLCEVDREGEGAATGVPTAEETGVVSRLEEMVIELEEAAEVQAKGGKGTIATPATRRVAREHSVDLKDVAGSGRDGRVSKSDVLAHVAALSRTTAIETTKVTTNVVPSPSSSPVTTPATTTTTIPLTSLRKAMFRAMSATLQIPHFSYSETIDITLLERLRLRLNSCIPTRYLKTHSPSQLAFMKRMREDWNVGEQVEDTRRYDRMTLLPLFIKALSVAMDQHPLFSCSLTPESTLLHRPTHDISIALSAPDGGLFTPLLQNVQASSPFHLASHIAHLQSLSTASSPPKFGTEYAGNGTITLSNVGVVGGRFTAPIIPPTGQLAIGAMGRSRIESRYLDSKGAREVAIHGGDGEGLKRVPRLVMVSLHFQSVEGC